MKFLIFLLSLTACNMQRPVPPDHLRVGLSNEPATLNPLFSEDVYAAHIESFLTDSLIEIDVDTFAWKPKLAYRWEVSEDRKTYTFYLREDVKWHDGFPFTADDIVYSFKLIQDPKVEAHVLRAYYNDVERVTKIDDYTVECVYKKVYFRSLTLCGGIPIVPKHLVEKYQDFNNSPYSRHLIGTGPYKMVKWISGSKIVVERNENYWGKKPQISRVEFKFIGDRAIAMQILKKLEVDVLELSPLQWAKQTSSKKFHTQFYKHLFPSRSFGYIGWNNKSFFFSDARVRQAMTHLLDREKIRDKLEFGIAKIVLSPFFPFSPQYNTMLTAHEFDPDRAKQLLSEAGWEDRNGDGVLDKNGKKFFFEFVYPAGATSSDRIVTIFKEELRKVGIEMKILRLEWAALLERIDKREFDATILGWLSPPENDPYQLWHQSQANIVGSSNYISYVNDEASDLIARAREEFDEEKRNQMYWRFQEILHAEQPYTFLYNRPNIVAISRRFDNVKIHKGGYDVLEWEVK